MPCQVCNHEGSVKKLARYLLGDRARAGYKLLIDNELRARGPRKSLMLSYLQLPLAIIVPS